MRISILTAEDHEGIGATFLGALGFPESVAYLTSKHVDAKRYRCAREPEYYRLLSDASKTTLRHQGGPFTEAECLEAEAEPLWPAVLRMRSYDEAAKETPPTGLRIGAFRDEIRAALRDSISQQLELHSAALSDPTAAAKLGARRYPLSQFASSYVLSPEQSRAWKLNGVLVVRDALEASTVSRLPSLADSLAQLPRLDHLPWLVHDEQTTSGKVYVCRVENFCKPLVANAEVPLRAALATLEWGTLASGLVKDMCS